MNFLRKKRGSRIAGLGALAALALTGFVALNPSNVASAASTSAAEVAASTAVTATGTIASSTLSVAVDTAFPRVIQYTAIPSREVIYGQEDVLTKIKINGTEYTPTVTSTQTADAINYTLTVAAINVSMGVQFKVAGSTLEYRVTSVTDTGTTKVKTFDIPQLSLISVRDSQTSATAAYNTNYINSDTITTVAAKAADAAPLKSGHAIFNTSSLAAALEVSATSQNSMIQTTAKTGYKRTAAWPAEFFYRGPDDAAVDLPWAKVIITGDRNSDSKVDWQDGGIAYRDIMDAMPGAVNLAQQSTAVNIVLNYRGRYPWTYENTLDTLKRQAMLTDKFPQVVQLKSWIDNNGHPQYGESNPVLGGNSALNWFIDSAQQYNINTGLHNDANEAYPDNPFYASTPLNLNGAPAWDLLNREGKPIDLTRYWSKDANGGQSILGTRFDQEAAAFPHVKFLYQDVEIGVGADAKWHFYNLLKKYREHGWSLFTEYSGGTVGSRTDNPNAIGAKYFDWTHVYLNDGNSDIRRFIMNDQTTIGSGSSDYQNVLGRGNTVDNYGYMGWVDNGVVAPFSKTVDNFWNFVMADTYLKNFQIQRVYNDAANGNALTAELASNVKSVYKDNTRSIYRDNKLMATLNATTTQVFMPYEPKAEQKILTYSNTATTKTWDLPVSWNNLTTAKLYKLTDTGRVFVKDLPVAAGKVSIDYLAKQGYVVLKGTSTEPAVIWGASPGVGLPDFEFSSGGFANWVRSGTATTSIETDALTANKFLKITGSAAGSVSQTITGLTPGKSYAVTSFARSEGGKPVSMTVSNYGGGPERTSSLDQEVQVKTERLDWPMLKVNFTVPAGQTTATITLKGLASPQGSGYFDDLRVKVEADPYNAGHYYYDGFEDTHWAGPFMHQAFHALATVSQYNALAADGTQNATPFTIADISGKHALRLMHWGNNHATYYGTVVKTLPSTLNFKKNTTYKVSFKYKPLYSSASGWQFKLNSGKGNVDYGVTDLTGAQNEIGTASLTFSTGSLDDVSLHIVNASNTVGDLVIDDITVDLASQDASTVVPPAAPKPTGPNLALGKMPTYSVPNVGNPGRPTDGVSDMPDDYAQMAQEGPQWMQVDLGQAYPIDKVRMVNYYNDARTYHDVIVQVSNDPTFATGVKTVFNNDTNNSAGQGTGTDAEYNETQAGKFVDFERTNARYVRFWTNGSNVNGGNHFIEQQVFSTPEPNGTNLALNKVPTYKNASVTNAAAPTDGNSDDAWGYAQINEDGRQWMQVELVEPAWVDRVRMVNFYADGRTYHDVIVQVSNDPTFSTGVTTVFNNDADNSSGQGVGTDAEYVETQAGKVVDFTPVAGRYVRFSTNGNTVNGGSHFVEQQVFSTVTPAGPNVALNKSTSYKDTPTSGVAAPTDGQTGNPWAYAAIAQSGPQWVQVDLGAQTWVDGARVVNFYDDARTYHDVIVQLSNDPSFSTGVTTVFNNDRDNSSGQGVGADAEFVETRAGKLIKFAATQARYVRFWTNGNTVNAGSHFVETQVFSSLTPKGENVALNKTPTFKNASVTNKTLPTDGITTNAWAYAQILEDGPQWMQIDLGAQTSVNGVRLVNFYADDRTYHDVIVQFSNDATFATGVTTVFNNDADNSSGQGFGTDAEYREYQAGKHINFDPLTARYVRFWTNGSNVNGGSHFVEQQVFKTAAP